MNCFAEARRLKKEGKIVVTWTMNCNLFVKKNEHANKVMIKSKQDLGKLKMYKWLNVDKETYTP